MQQRGCRGGSGLITRISESHTRQSDHQQLLPEPLVFLAVQKRESGCRQQNRGPRA